MPTYCIDKNPVKWPCLEVVGLGNGWEASSQKQVYIMEGKLGPLVTSYAPCNRTALGYLNCPKVQLEMLLS